MKKYLFYLIIVFPIALAAQKNGANVKSKSENRLDEKYAPKDIKSYTTATSSSSGGMDELVFKNKLFFDLGPLVRFTFLGGYERVFAKRLATNIQIGTALPDQLTRVLYNEFYGDNAKNIPASTLLSDANSGNLGLATAVEFKIYTNLNGDPSRFFKIGWRHTGFTLEDNRTWDIQLNYNSNTRISIAEPTKVKVKNNFLYLGFGSTWEGSGGKSAYINEFFYGVGLKSTKYDANYETKQSYLERNGISRNNYSNFPSGDDANTSVYTGGVFGEPLKTSNVFFLMSYRITFGFK
jgi:hypothetical protein